MRRSGSWSEQWALLFRDYLWANPVDRALYVATKTEAAGRFPTDMKSYEEYKTDAMWLLIRRADAWAKTVGWHTGPSDG